VTLYDAAVAELTRWNPPAPDQAALQAAYLRHLSDHRDGLARECHPDHITASLLVVDESRERVLLNLHARYRIWVQLGGHCESSDESLAVAALREGIEESGIETLRLVGSGPAQLSTHEVRCGPMRPAHHLDVRYVAVAAATARPVVSSESLDVRWFDIDALPEDLEPELHDLVTIARRS
jgi:8-oxo-dGTP pyrophosphatase MutT (NUDIX family)